MRIVNKTVLASLLNVSKSRVSQYVRLGMPVRPDGLVDAEAAAEWVREHIDPGKAPIMRRSRVAQASGGAEYSEALPPPLPFAWVVKATLRAAYGAAIDEGIEAPAAMKVAQLAALMVWSAVEESHGLVGQLTMDPADLELPGREDRRRTVPAAMAAGSAQDRCGGAAA